MTNNGVKCEIKRNEHILHTERIEYRTPMQMLSEGGVKICSPMVRYSK